MRKAITLASLVGLTSISYTALAVDQALNTKKLSSNPQIEKLIIPSAKVKVSRKVSDISKPIPKLTKQRKRKLQVSGQPVPGVDEVKTIPNRFPFESKWDSMVKVKDPSIQNSMPRKPLAAQSGTNVGVSFDGVGNVLGVAPPDTNGDVGPNHYVQAVNVAMAIYDKEGNELVAPFAINDLWSGFGGICETNNDGDPIILYDGMADRWMISQFALNGTDNHECIAISTTGDPTGEYYLYDFPYGELMNDYPHLGVWPDGYYMGVNQFDPAAGFAWAGGGVAVYEREKMLVGAPAQQIIFSMRGNDPEVFTPMPLDLDGMLPPSQDQNQLFVWADGSGESTLHVWEMDVDWDNTENTTFSPKAALDVAAWNSPGNAIQPNGVELDGMPIRSMFRAAYRNMGDRGAITFTHNVAGTDGNTPALRWYELSLDATGNITVKQEGTFAPDEKARWMGSGAMDAQGNMAFGYSVSSTNLHPSSHAAIRMAGDPQGTLTEEIVLKAGEGSQTSINRFRWGDYSSMSIDPSDDCTFWYTTEYYKSEDDNTLGWSTNISSFKIPTCTAGPSGEIIGRVTDSETGEALEKVKVSAGNVSTYTDSEGNYTLTLPVGEYEVTASRYGWKQSDVSRSELTEDEVETINFSLAGAEQVTVSGKIKDGGMAQWPLYAKVSVSVPGDTLITYTNPESGEFSLPLYEGTTVKFMAEAIDNGYISLERDVLPTVGQQNIEMFDLAVNPNCTAPGYVINGFQEKFEGSFPPAGWTVTDNAGNGVIWGSSRDDSQGNITGTDGDTAIINSDAAGPVDVSSELISPMFTVAELDSTILNFVANHVTFTGADQLSLDISVDGGEWQTVEVMTKGDNNLVDGLASYSIDVATYVDGAANFKLRWNYTNANWEWFAAIDDVQFGTPACEPIAGSLISGYVHDANFDLPLEGASLKVDGISVSTAMKTEMDENLADGFIHAFIPADAQSVTISKGAYKTKEVTASDIMLSAPIALKAGLLESATDKVELSVTKGRDFTHQAILKNIGGLDTNYKLLTLPSSLETAGSGIYHSSARHFGPKNLEDFNTKKIRHFPEIDAKAMTAPTFVGGFALSQGFGWGIGLNKLNGHFWVGDVVAAGAEANQLIEYNASGELTTNKIDTPFVDIFGADLAFNGRTNTLWQVNVGGDNCIYEVEPTSMTVTGKNICPEFGTSQRGLAYDPVSDTYYAGSWNDGVIHQFTTTGELLRSINVNLSVAGLAFNPSTGHLFVTHNGPAEVGIFDIYVLDTNTDLLDMIGGFNVELDVDGDDAADIGLVGQAGLDIDCEGNLWAVDQEQQVVLGFSSGESNVCEWSKVDWLTLDNTSGMVEAESEAKLELAGSAMGDEGVHNATIVVSNDTPYGSLNIPVELTITAPNYGEIGFAAASASVKNGETVELVVSRTNGSDFEVSVDYMVVNGNAVSGTHFTVAEGTLTWGDLDVEDKTITIETTDIDLDERANFSVILKNEKMATLSTSSVGVTIEPDNLGMVQMATTSVSVEENAGSANITVNRVDGSDREISVNYSILAASATVEDYNSAGGTVTWADGDTASKTIKVNITDDSKRELDESFNVVLSSDTVKLGNNVTAVVIKENDKKDSGSFGFIAAFGLILMVLRRRIKFI
ncbi:Calx-beta domain-containing protein [Pseudoalteromonas sp. SSM20]|uniref:Calx-beta domain-containing protein n=1 Tax=Pseudoalteromonas sp. SSM20 TaxID=3139394 RepID=UPI003BAD2A37